MASEAGLLRVVWTSIEAAIDSMDRLALSATFEATKAMVADLPAPRRLRLGQACKAWRAILFVDLRGSTRRAEEIGPRATYITMHALLPALAHLVSDEGGFIVG